MNRPARDLDILAVVVDLVADKDLWDQVHRLIDHRLQLGQVIAEGAGFLLGAALADAEMNPPLGQYVQQGDALGNLDRVVHRRRQAYDPVAQADAGGSAGEVGQERLGHAHMGIVGQRSVFDRPDHVEAHFLGQHRLLDHVLEDPPIAGSRRVGGLCFIDQ